ncbi:MAG: hypothetical protein AAGA66_00890 [Bacteroidota bacterium]
MIRSISLFLALCLSVLTYAQTIMFHPPVIRVVRSLVPGKIELSFREESAALTSALVSQEVTISYDLVIETELESEYVLRDGEQTPNICERSTYLAEVTSTPPRIHRETLSDRFTGNVENVRVIGPTILNPYRVIYFDLENAEAYARLRDYWIASRERGVLDEPQFVAPPSSLDPLLVEAELCGWKTIQYHVLVRADAGLGFDICIQQPTFTMECTSGQIVAELPSGTRWRDNHALSTRTVEAGTILSIEFIGGNCVGEVRSFTFDERALRPLLRRCASCTDTYLSTCFP